MNRLCVSLLLAGTALALLTRTGVAAPAAPIELRDGDRVAFIGDTLIEREQAYGWVELALTRQAPGRSVSFRNLGWSADTPGGDSRFGLSLLQAGLEPADEGWRQLQKQLTEYKPTVAVFGYGLASSFDGPAGIAKFRADFERLLKFLDGVSPGYRAVFLNVVAPEATGPLAADAATRAKVAENTRLYSAAIAEIAAGRSAPVVDIQSLLAARPAPAPGAELTDNGLHLNSAGYQTIAPVVAAAFVRAPGGSDAPAVPAIAEAMRQVILRKNEFFFYRSRPANMAYIFGFRRGEQGRNAVEMPQFDPMIEREEAKLRTLGRELGNASFQVGADLRPAALRTNSAAARFMPQKTPEFITGEGLTVTLWAENPFLNKPIHMNFDARGRLWVASSEVYPHIEPGQAPTDKIIVLEDTDGDGKAEKSTVFAEGLLIPTGVEVGDGGCYVAQSTELLHFRDTDGDGKADVRRTVLGGFGTEDTHHNLHTLRWGPDGRLWMNQSIYTRTDTETPHGVVRHKSGAVMALDTKSLDFEVIFKGWCNPWGHVFDPYGQSYVTDGAGGKGVSWALPGAMYFTYARMRREMPSISPGNYPKFASLELIHSQALPPDWQGSFITCDFRANRVTRFSVKESGGAYITKQEPDVLRTTASTFRPIDVKLGPDGALYIADWSNPIIQHGEVDFRDPRRDRSHGRIWRVTWDGGHPWPVRDLTRLSTAALLDELVSKNDFPRNQARRVLQERGAAEVMPALTTWLARQTDDRARLEGVWLAESLGQPQPRIVEQLAQSRNPDIRVAAIRLLASR